MDGVPMSNGLIVAGLLFSLGLIGVLVRRNVIFILLSIEVMLNAAGLAFVVAGSRWGQADGQIVFLFILAMAAADDFETPPLGAMSPYQTSTASCGSAAVENGALALDLQGSCPKVVAAFVGSLASGLDASATVRFAIPARCAARPTRTWRMAGQEA